MAKNFGFCLNPRFGQIIVIALLSRSHPVFCSLYMGKSLALFPALLTLCFWYVVSIIHRSGRSSGKKKQGRVVKYGALYNCYTTTAILFFLLLFHFHWMQTESKKWGTRLRTTWEWVYYKDTWALLDYTLITWKIDLRIQWNNIPSNGIEVSENVYFLELENCTVVHDRCVAYHMCTEDFCSSLHTVASIWVGKTNLIGRISIPWNILLDSN